MAQDQPCYTLLTSAAGSTYTEQKFKDDLENPKVEVKREALKELIRVILNGEKFPNLLMVVIRFVMPSQDHSIKKLLLLFFEVVPKYSADGKLLHEMILVCDAYRRDLQHPNEFLRGSTLRFLCKLKEAELLEPLMPAIKQCLEHKHSYVRRNAVLAIFTIYKNFDSLIPDAPDVVLRFLEAEGDACCKRNAFMMLLHVSQSSALNYLSDHLDEVETFDDILQLVIVELIYKVCLSNPSERMRFIRCVYSLLQSKSSAVRYEAATTLVVLSSAPSAVKAAANCFINLISKENDNNVKLIVLSRLTELRNHHEQVIQGSVMDILQILAASDLEIRRQTLQLVSDLVSVRYADDVMKLLRKELMKTLSTIKSASTRKSKDAKSNENDDESVFRFELVHCMYDIGIRFPETLESALPAICEMLTYEDVGDSSAGNEACRMLREVLQKFPDHRAHLFEKLMDVFPSVTGVEAVRHLLWIFGEFCSTLEEINAFLTMVRQALGDLPLVDNEVRRLTDENGADEAHQSSALFSSDGGVQLAKAHLVTADGTYATQTYLTASNPGSKSKGITRPSLQAALFSSHFLPAVVLSSSLVKICQRYRSKLSSTPDADGKLLSRLNAFSAECMFIIASILHLAQSGILPQQINPDHIDRMWICLKLLAVNDADVLAAFNSTSRSCLSSLVACHEADRRAVNRVRREADTQAQQQTDISRVEFGLLTSGGPSSENVDRFELTMSQALGEVARPGGSGLNQPQLSSRLRKIHQLTGFSDPVYAEAYVNVNQFDINLDVLLVNQTKDTLQNLTLELSCLGDLRLVEKPVPLAIAAQGFANLKASIKVSSTENGVIFGNISYDVRGSAGETTCIVLNNIHIDIMEYIIPATCTPMEFRQMWSEFEWENKVTVNTPIKELTAYLDHISAHTNLCCLAPAGALEGDCDYLCTTLYAKTVFGENVLANLCLEKPGLGQPVTGHMRIRAKTQGMAVTMGEKVSACQKKVKSSSSSPEEMFKLAAGEDAPVGVMRSHSPALIATA